ncbi:hypothetical protein D9M68_652750 [compost metagenome]
MLFYLILNLGYIGWTLLQYNHSEFSVEVAGNKAHLADVKSGAYTLSELQIHGLFHFKSSRFLDVILMNKVPDTNLLFSSFTAIIIFQLIRIKSLWYHQRFTSRLYRNIDALGIIALIMFILARVQERYVVNRITELSAGSYEAVVRFYMTSVSVIIIILSGILKSFARQGNLIQDEQKLTI